MKVYQIVQCNNSYGEHNEYIEGTYLNRDKAEEVKQEKDNVKNLKCEAFAKCSACYNEGYCTSNTCYEKGDNDNYDCCYNETCYEEVMDSEYEIREFDVIE